MELFLLLKKNDSPANKLFRELDGKLFDHDCMIKETDNYILLINKKTKATKYTCYEDKRGSLFGTGTFFYRKQDPDESIRLLFNDYMSGNIDCDSLYGHYFIFIMSPGQITILNDSTSLIKAYHDNGGSYLTSSFLLALRLHETLSLNRLAVTENLLTGGITGTETVVNEIMTFDHNSEKLFPDIIFRYPAAHPALRCSSSRLAVLEEQSALLDDYFSSCKTLADKYGADIGLTGGYDSRLLLAYARKYFKNYGVHSHFRQTVSKEWVVAKQIADGENIPFASPEVESPYGMSDEKLIQVIRSSYLFYDGAVRMHANWMEEYNTQEYRRKLLGDMTLGFSGIGGEQYRNHDRLYLKPWLFKNWLKYYFVRRTSGVAIPVKKSEEELLEHIRTKIFRILDFNTGKQWIDLADLKRIQNEVIMPAYRGARISAENRYAWFLGPFTDQHIAPAAYSIVGYLKDSKSFETDLIKMADPVLAAYPTNYGYNLTDGEPVYTRMGSSAFENLLPAGMKWEIRERFKNKNALHPLLQKIRSSELLTGYVNKVMELGLPVSVPVLLGRENTACMVVSMGYFIENCKTLKER